MHDLSIPDEDSLSLENRDSNALASLDGARVFRAGSPTILDIAAIALRHLSNFDDLDPIEREEGVRVRWVDRAVDLGSPDRIIIPGTTTTVASVQQLKGSALPGRITELVHPENAAALATPIIGICGGFQILGELVEDNDGVEAPAGTRVAGLGLLRVITAFAREKTTCLARSQVRDPRGLLEAVRGADLTGQEIHIGHTIPSSATTTLPVPHPFTIAARQGRTPSNRNQTGDGCLDVTDWILGTYRHGLFDTGRVRRAILSAVLARRAETLMPPQSWGTSSGFESKLNRLGTVAHAIVDSTQIREIVGL